MLYKQLYIAKSITFYVMKISAPDVPIKFILAVNIVYIVNTVYIVLMRSATVYTVLVGYFPLEQSFPRFFYVRLYSDDN